MEDFFNKLATDPAFVVLTAFLGLIGTFASIYGIYVTIHLSRRSRKVARYTIRSTPIFMDLPREIPELTIRYARYGQPISNLTVTKLLLWNAGADPIRKQDIPTSDPIQVVAKGDCKILHAEVVRAHNPASRFQETVNRDRNKVVFSFEFLQANQPALVKVVHTGRGTADLELTGQVIGAGPFVLIPYYKFASQLGRRYNRITTSAIRFAAWISRKKYGVAAGFLYSFLSMFVICFSAYKIYLYFEEHPAEEAWQISFWEVVIYGTMAYYCGLVGHYILRRAPPLFFEEFEADL